MPSSPTAVTTRLRKSTDKGPISAALPPILATLKNSDFSDFLSGIPSDLRGHIVDHVSFVDIAVTVVSARLPATEVVNKSLSDLRLAIDVNSEWGFYAHMWLLSKYGTEDELFLLIDQGEKVWITNEHLSRTAASVYPSFIGHSHERAIVGIMEKSNIRARQAFQFQHALQTTIEGVTAIKKFLVARNTSLPNRISHSKFLMLASALKNTSIAPTLTNSLRKAHAWALTDQYYYQITK